MEALIGVITVSDTRVFETDESGPATIEALRILGFERFKSVLVKDEIEPIQSAIKSLGATCQAIFTTGGTGFAPRDVTPEATAPLLDRRADNLVELIRLKGLEKTPYSHMSRAVAGVMGSTLVVNLPGSPKGARESVEALGSLLALILEGLKDYK